MRELARYFLACAAVGAAIVLMQWFCLTGIAILASADINSHIEKSNPDRVELPAARGKFGFSAHRRINHRFGP